MGYNINAIMNTQFRFILTTASLLSALAIWFPNEVRADELKEAKVTQVIQDVKVLPSNASPRPAAVNDNVRPGTAVQTGVQSRSELTFKDQTITRLGEKTIFSVGEGARSIDLGSGHSLLLRGRIDRVDLQPQPNGEAYVVVIDYKSSGQELEQEQGRDAEFLPGVAGLQILKGLLPEHSAADGALLALGAHEIEQENGRYNDAEGECRRN